MLKVQRLSISSSSKVFPLSNPKKKMDWIHFFSFLHLALTCCDKGGTFHCRETCRAALKAGEPDALDIVERHCGSVSLTEPLWACFMHKAPPSTASDKSANAVNDIKNG